jgi:hypothetical protein
MNALLEIRLEDESPVVIRFRFDLKVARQAKLDTKWIVSVDPAMGWQRIDENTLLASIDRAIELKQRLQQQFQAADLQIDQAVDSDLRRILRLSRKQLEQQRTQAETYLQRLNQLQTLLSRTMRELRIQATVGN